MKDQLGAAAIERLGINTSNELVRYCPECGSIGPIHPPALTCCPDSFGMSMKRWQAEKMERVLDEARGRRRVSQVEQQPPVARPLPKPWGWFSAALNNGAHLHRTEPHFHDGALYTAEQMLAYAAPSSQAPQQPTEDTLRTERDYWAQEAMAWRRKYAALRYPGMTHEVKAASVHQATPPAVDAQAASFRSRSRLIAGSAPLGRPARGNPEYPVRTDFRCVRRIRCEECLQARPPCGAPRCCRTCRRFGTSDQLSERGRSASYAEGTHGGPLLG